MSVWETGIPKEAIFTRIFQSDEAGFDTGKEEIPVISGKINIKMPPFSAMILRYEKR